MGLDGCITDASICITSIVSWLSVEVNGEVLSSRQCQFDCICSKRVKGRVTLNYIVHLYSSPSSPKLMIYNESAFLTISIPIVYTIPLAILLGLVVLIATVAVSVQCGCQIISVPSHCMG